MTDHKKNSTPAICVLLLPLLCFLTGCFTGDMLTGIARQPELTETIEAYMQEKGIPGEARETTMIADRPAQDYSSAIVAKSLWC